MKALMNLAKQKRQLDSSNQSSSITQKSHLNKFPQPPSQMSDQPEDYDGDYEPQIQQIIAYAEFIGIKLPEEEDLLWIAKEGLQTQLPPDWEQAETQAGQIAYTNIRTGQIMFEHPCDQYYRQLVIKERKKTPSKISMKSNLSGSPFQPIGSVSSKPKSLLQKQPQPIIDPLVKMQRQKEQKKLQEQKKKQYSEKKESIKQKFQSKKQEIQKDYKAKQEKSKSRFAQEVQKQRRQNIQKMSQQQKQQQKKRQEEIRQFQKQTKEKQERQLQDKTRKQKEKMQKKYQQKRQLIKKSLQSKLKEEKKQIDQIYKQKYRQLQIKQKAIQQQAIKISSNALLEEQISVMKSQIIRKKLAKYSEKLKQQTEKQKRLYAQEVQKLQIAHNLRIKQLQQKSSSQSFSVQSNQKLQSLIKQIQSYEKEQLKIFEYELDVMKEMKRFQLEEKVQEYKMKINQLHKQKLANISKEMEKEFGKFKQLKEEEYQKIILQTQKKAKQDFLHGLKILERKFAQEEEITLLQNRSSSNHAINKTNIVEKENLESLNRVYQQLQFKEKELKKQRENIKLQIQNLRSQSSVSNPTLKMNEQQNKLYQLIQEKIRDGYRSR